MSNIFGDEDETFRSFGIDTSKFPFTDFNGKMLCGSLGGDVYFSWVFYFPQNKSFKYFVEEFEVSRRVFDFHRKRNSWGNPGELEDYIIGCVGSYDSLFHGLTKALFPDWSPVDVVVPASIIQVSDGYVVNAELGKFIPRFESLFYDVDKGLVLEGEGMSFYFDVSFPKGDFLVKSFDFNYGVLEVLLGHG